MNRDEFFTKLAPLDEDRLRRARWNLHWRGTAQMREHIEAEGTHRRPGPASHQRAVNLARTRELVHQSLERLPGHQGFLDFAAEIDALPPGAQQIADECAALGSVWSAAAIRNLKSEIRRLRGYCVHVLCVL